MLAMKPKKEDRNRREVSQSVDFGGTPIRDLAVDRTEMRGNLTTFNQLVEVYQPKHSRRDTVKPLKSNIKQKEVIQLQQVISSFHEKSKFLLDRLRQSVNDDKLT